MPSRLVVPGGGGGAHHGHGADGGGGGQGRLVDEAGRTGELTAGAYVHRIRSVVILFNGDWRKKMDFLFHHLSVLVAMMTLDGTILNSYIKYLLYFRQLNDIQYEKVTLTCRH